MDIWGHYFIDHFQASFMSFFIGLIAIVSVTLVIERRLITKVELGKIKNGTYWVAYGGPFLYLAQF